MIEQLGYSVENSWNIVNCLRNQFYVLQTFGSVIKICVLST